MNPINQTDNLPALTDEFCLKEFGWTKSRFEVVQRTYFKGLSMDDISVFGHVCKHVGLDPFLKQIYPVIRDVKQKDGSKKPTMSIQTGIDGYRAIAERTGKYAPGKEPLFKYDKDGRLHSATAYVMKMTNDGKWHEVAATAILSEYRPAFQNDFWATKAHIMLSKCAEALALRKAFPAELSGVYTKEEMDQAGNPEMEQAEYEIKDNNLQNLALNPPNKPSISYIKDQNMYSSPKIDTNMDHLKPDTDMDQLAKEEPKISEEELKEFLTSYANTDDVFKVNFEKYIFDKWNTVDFKNFLKKDFHLIMGWINKNLEMQAMAVK